jgi:uncharacterized protein YkwD
LTQRRPPAPALVALLAALAGCGPAPGPAREVAPAQRPSAAGSGPQLAPDAGGEGAFALPDLGASHYSSAAEPPLPLEDFGATLRRAMPGALEADGRLDAAAELIARAEESGVRITVEFSRELLWWQGVPEAQSILGRFSGATDFSLVGKVADWAAREQRDGAFRYGLATRPIPGGTRVAAIMLRPGAALEPTPRRLDGPGPVTLRGRVPAGTGEMTLVATGPDETTARQPVRRSGERFEIATVLPVTGVWQVELMGDGARGPTVLANFPVRVGVPLPASVGVAAAELESRDPRELERILFEMLARTRQERALGPLEPFPALSDVARRYSEEMARTGQVAHVSARSGGPADRAAAAGLRFSRLRENLARAHSAAEVHAGLMGSPSHRANLLDPLAYQAGIGVILVDDDDGTYLLVTQLFVSRPPAIDPAAAEREIAGETARRRALGGLPALNRSPGLDRAARQLLGSCFGGKRAGDVDFGGDGLARVVAFEVTAAVLGDALVEAPAALLDPATTHFGVAATQGRDPELGEGMICLRLLLGQKR